MALFFSSVNLYKPEKAPLREGPNARGGARDENKPVYMVYAVFTIHYYDCTNTNPAYRHSSLLQAKVVGPPLGPMNHL